MSVHFPVTIEGGAPVQSLQKDENYYMNDSPMIFQVGNRLYRIPTYLLSKESQLFAETFVLPQQAPNIVEGPSNSESNPILLPSDISNEDFGNFLEALYPLSFSLQRNLTTAKWISILKLSTKWHFIKLRACAISELERTLNELSSIQIVQLGRSCKVSSWVVKGLEACVEATFPMTDEEAEALDLDYPTTAYRLFRIREKKLCPEKYNLTSPVSVIHEIEGSFMEQLASVRSAENMFKDADAEKPFHVQQEEEQNAEIDGNGLEGKPEEKKTFRNKMERLVHERKMRREAQEREAQEKKERATRVEIEEWERTKEEEQAILRMEEERVEEEKRVRVIKEKEDAWVIKEKEDVWVIKKEDAWKMGEEKMDEERMDEEEWMRMTKEREDVWKLEEEQKSKIELGAFWGWK